MRVFQQWPRRLIACGLWIAVLVGLFGAASWADGPQPAERSTAWPQFRNDNRQLGVAGSSLPEKLELLWEIEAADGFASTAAIVGDRVYVGTIGGELLCLQRQTGKRVWTYHSAPKEENTFLPAFKSSPTVTADTIYLGDEDGVFHAVDHKTGRQKWTFQTDGEIISSASVKGDRVLFGSYDNNLYCLKTADGSLLWKFATEGYVHCTPAIADKFTFVTGCDEQLRIIDIETGKQEASMSLESYIIASPAVLGDVLYVGTHNSEVVAVDWKKLEFVWKYKDPRKEFPYQSSAAVSDDFVVVGGRDKQLHGIDRTSGERVWVLPTRGRIDSSPVIVGNRAFVGSSDRNVYGVDLKTGREIWKFNTGKEVTASPAVGEGCLVIGSEAAGANGSLYCFGAK
jgi:eukaryotic-like serine/threonine-protein kinase